MKNYIRQSVILAIAVVTVMTSCRHDGSKAGSADQAFGDKASVYENGVTLRIEDADLIQVDSNPQYNTAEWNLTVKKPGRYDVWLSSLTRDTLHLSFADNVTITAGDTRLTKRPVGDQIITDNSIKGPWYRADSHMGSVFFSQPGEYQVQVISDGVIPHSSDLSDLNTENHTLINSLILKPKVN